MPRTEEAEINPAEGEAKGGEISVASRRLPPERGRHCGTENGARIAVPGFGIQSETCTFRMECGA